MKPETIKLGDRTFSKLVDGGTVEHYLWFTAHIARAGLSEVKMMEGEAADIFARRLLETALMSGQVLEMLGGLLLPDGKKPEEWTPEIAEQTAKFIGGLTANDDKSTINNLIASLLLDFFVTGLTWPYRSQSSSGAGQPVEDQNPPTNGMENGTPLSGH